MLSVNALDSYHLAIYDLVIGNAVTDPTSSLNSIRQSTS